ncbi:MAG: DeoR/GlpR family DNA-binding transcription regulator [Candidatus Bipolaricaulis sp.]|nr:DeoR/GlpR family DNA-binding transcription regulator [Candidatus Bipolaricaulis sp.]
MARKHNRVLTEERRRLILEELRERGVVRTGELARRFSVSAMTIRSDLTALEERGGLVRVHGGAMLRERVAREPSYYEKAARNLDEKRRIGRQAATLIEDGMAIFIGNGTTTIEIVRALRERPLAEIKVFTNALTHATELAEIPSVEVYVIGGYLRGVSFAMVGPLARQALEGVYFDLAFLGANGLSLDQGITIPSLEEAETAAEIVAHARKVVAVVDHTKFGAAAHGRIAGIDELDVVITDCELPPGLGRALAQCGVEVVVA